MMKAVYVRSTRAVDYAGAIVKGYKTIETRSKNTLKSLVGERVAIIRTTGKAGQSRVVGYVTISGCWYCPSDQFDSYRDQTLIQPGSTFDLPDGGAGKWFYTLSDPVSIIPKTPQKLSNFGRIWTIIE